ncbi:ABC transporter permease [Campylobacter volucris]|uniref:Transport permease protein n=1 Tax=Campylobacter volucris TaxID=1031542 RepID=A0A5C7DVR3_9BACT|nr:ABC transporter permease [Campylobacter volucris]TXE89696.1 ABC transporter permease [Campylobacter volucris]
MIDVIHALFFRELKTRFGINKHLGYFWVVGEPLLILLVILFIVTAIREFHHQIMPANISIFMFLAVGIIPFFMFRSMINQIITGISSNLTLFAYKPVRPIHVFIARALLEFCIYFTIFIVVMFIAGWFLHLDVLPKHILEVLFLFFLLLLSGFSLGICFAIAGHFVEPLKIFLTYFSIVFYWTSGVIFPTFLTPRNILDLLYYNPLLHIFELLKYNFFDDYPLMDDYNYIYPILCICVVLFIALFMYYYNRQALIAVRKT